MGYYIRSRAASWLLCVCLNASMTAAICSGFILSDGLSDNLLALFTISAVLQAVLVLLAYSRRIAIAGIAAGAALAAAVVFYIYTRRPLADETANSTFLFLLIELAAAILVFLLSRTRVGSAVLFLVGTLIQAGVQFLQFPAPLWGFLLFPAAALILFFYRTYTVSLLKADMGKVRTGAYLRQAVLVCLAALVAAGGVYFGVVRPLNPPTQELKLIRVLRSMPLLEVLGVSSTEIILDPDTASQEPPEEEDLGGEEGQDENAGLEGWQPESQPPEIGDVQTQLNDILQQLTAVRYDKDTLQLLWLLLLVPAAIAGVFILRMALKRRWHRRVQALPKTEAVLAYYQFFLSRLGKIGLKRTPAHTLREYAALTAVQLQAFNVGECTFGRLTAVYEKTLYGHCQVSEAEYQAFETFYGRFYRNLRREIGTGKYLLQIFRF